MTNKFNAKSIFYYVLVLGTIFLIRTLSSCSKNELQAPVETNHLTYASTQNNFQVDAYNIHNEYLDYLCTKIDARELNTQQSAQNIAQFKLLTTQFFSLKYGQDYSFHVNAMVDKFLNGYSTPNGIVSAYHDPSLNQFIIGLNSLYDFNNPMSVPDFVASSNALLNTYVSNHPNKGIFEIIGVAQGSYYYWNNLTSNSCYNALLPNDGSRACGSKCKKLVGFAMADLAGAADGMAVGAVLGGVGAGPGAIMGGAIYSGLSTFLWD